jgi:hypothetical protein
MTGGLDPRELEFARAFIASRHWREAVTMPENPHTYWPRREERDDQGREDFDWFTTLIRGRGWRGRWEGRWWTYLTVDSFTYWEIPPVINRKPTEQVPRPEPNEEEHP